MTGFLIFRSISIELEDKDYHRPLEKASGYTSPKREINGRKYSTCTVGFGSEGMKCLVFEEFVDKKGNPTGKQIALIETQNSGQLLDRYQVTAQGDAAGLSALFFGLYWDNNLFHKSNAYYEKSYLVSWGKQNKY